MSYKYPIDVCTSQNKKQTYSVESHLSVAKTEDAQSPLKIYNDTFSLYKHTIIEKDKAPEEKVVTANIKVKEMEDIFRRSDYAFHKSMEYECMPKTTATGEAGTSPAFTVKITSGVLKGKTPAEVLLENPQNEKALNQQYKWLKENLGRYPRNQIQMDAILDAANLKKEGKLQAASTEAAATQTPRIRIYPSTSQVTPKPLRRKTREDGRCFIYEMEVYWNIGDDYPVEITIRNYWAPVREMEDKTLRVSQKDAMDRVEKTMRLSEADWLNHLRTIEDDMDSFKMLNAKGTREDATKTWWDNRNAAQAK